MVFKAFCFELPEFKARTLNIDPLSDLNIRIDSFLTSSLNTFVCKCIFFEKVGLKLNIQKTRIMASGPTTSWQIDGETVADFVFWGSKITADDDWSHEIKRHLLLGRKVMTNLERKERRKVKSLSRI